MFTSAFDRVGMPEGRFHLAHAVLYLATAPKSNSSLGFFDALSLLQSEQRDGDVPNHLRDASRDAEGFGHGEEAGLGARGGQPLGFPHERFHPIMAGKDLG